MTAEAERVRFAIDERAFSIVAGHAPPLHRKKTRTASLSSRAQILFGNVLLLSAKFHFALIG
jgi:hypothetical protein